jgi:hypothetical protein
LRRQAVPARHRAHRLAARAALGDDQRLLVHSPPPTPTRPGEYLHPAHSLRLKQKLSVRHVSNRSIQRSDNRRLTAGVEGGVKRPLSLEPCNPLISPHGPVGGNF